MTSMASHQSALNESPMQAERPDTIATETPPKIKGGRKRQARAKEDVALKSSDDAKRQKLDVPVVRATAPKTVRDMLLKLRAQKQGTTEKQVEAPPEKEPLATADIGPSCAEAEPA